MLTFTDRATIYRSVASTSRGPRARSEKPIYTNVPCLVVPISTFDRAVNFARESTHVAWVPRWLELLREDELRVGRRTDDFGDKLLYGFVINGTRRFRVGLQQRAYYATERE